MAKAQPNAGLDAINFGALCNFTALLVSHARDYAREGHKDYARDIVRFVANARVLPILKAHGCGFSTSLGKLESDLAALRSECHPEAVATFGTELQTIRAQLDKILKAIPAATPAQTDTYDSSAEGCRPQPRSGGGGFLVYESQLHNKHGSYL